MQDETAKNLEMPAAAGAAEPREEVGNLMMDDINIPLVATAVAGFVAFLAVLIISLQVAYYHYQASEQARKTLSQEDKSTELGALLADQRQELQTGPGSRRLASGATATSTASQAKRDTRPIEEAMRMVSREYIEWRSP